MQNSAGDICRKCSSALQIRLKKQIIGGNQKKLSTTL
ncbi:unnamed protein product [Rhodiola kirilowii]